MTNGRSRIWPPLFASGSMTMRKTPGGRSRKCFITLPWSGFFIGWRSLLMPTSSS